MLKMKDVTKVYRTAMVETHALRELSIEVREGEFVAVTGPSGSGKTTFLNIAGLLEEHTGGQYTLDGVDVKGLGDRDRSKLRNEKIGFVFQSFNLIPDLNLFDNVDVPLRYRGFARGDRKARIEKALERVGLASRMRLNRSVTETLNRKFGSPATVCPSRTRYTPSRVRPVTTPSPPASRSTPAPA